MQGILFLQSSMLTCDLLKMVLHYSIMSTYWKVLTSPGQAWYAGLRSPMSRSSLRGHLTSMGLVSQSPPSWAIIHFSWSSLKRSKIHYYTSLPHPISNTQAAEEPSTPRCWIKSGSFVQRSLFCSQSARDQLCQDWRARIPSLRVSPWFPSATPSNCDCFEGPSLAGCLGWA